MAQTQTKVKSFADIPQEDVSERLRELTLAIFDLVHKGEKDRDYEPVKCSEIHRIWRNGKLSRRQQIGWYLYWQDVQKSAGRSDKSTGGYSDYTDGGADGFRTPRAWTNRAYENIQRIKSSLDRGELSLLRDLEQNVLGRRASLSIEAIGIAKSGFNSKAQAYASGVTNVQRLCDRLASEYGY